MKSQQSKVPFNLNEIKKQARRSLEQGAITEDYPLNLQEACAHLNKALATEIMCVLRYRHHQVIAKSIDRPQVVAEFVEHADDEQRHMMMIAERINQLGGDPDFNPDTVLERTATDYGSGTDLLKLVEDDLIAERIAIMIYRDLIEWFGPYDPTTRRMLEEILKDEEDHADDLSDLLASRKH
ncbi:DNA protection during starvation protein [Legionella santicrucis]|uniref:DNA protection during starvation protein n=1 Tax=Legionella santicrucis TaxID=45074 RepID=A0A0W0YF18_9GAMM|nr:ferritin-like domain-containing protein [Legionella santicrucis]KTD55544.1 DNA protection during starvation protein [Legionella santicrucis]